MPAGPTAAARLGCRVTLGALRRATGRPVPLPAHPWWRRSFRSSPPAARNRILFAPDEHPGGGAAGRTLRLPPEDARAIHVCTVLRSEVGDELRVGVVGAGAGVARVASLGGDGAVELAFLDACVAPAGPPPALDLVLCLPRPKVLRRLLAQLAALGLRSLTLSGADKVEAVYWGSHLLRDEAMREELLRGLEQAGDTVLPPVLRRRRLGGALAAAEHAAGPGAARLVAHPGATARLAALAAAAAPAGAGAVLVIGPEGGFTEGELGALHARGYQEGSVGARVLTTETAAVVCVGVVADALRGPE